MSHVQNYGATRYGPKGVYRLPEDPVITQHAGAYASMLYWACTVAYNWGCTEFLAWQLHDDRHLHLKSYAGMYFPGQWLWWTCALLTMQYQSATFAIQVRAAFILTVAFAIVGFALSLWLFKYAYRRALLKADRPPDLRGSAHWATSEEVRASGARSHTK